MRSYITDDIRHKIYEDGKHGYKPIDIAQRYGVSISTANRYIISPVKYSEGTLEMRKQKYLNPEPKPIECQMPADVDKITPAEVTLSEIRDLLKELVSLLK